MVELEATLQGFNYCALQAVRVFFGGGGGSSAAAAAAVQLETVFSSASTAVIKRKHSNRSLFEVRGLQSI